MLQIMGAALVIAASPCLLHERPVYKRRQIPQHKQDEAASAYIPLRGSADSRLDEEIKRQNEYCGVANQTQADRSPVFPEPDDDARSANRTPEPVERGEQPSFHWFGGRRQETLEHRCNYPI
jgi:hypothetical protein